MAIDTGSAIFGRIREGGTLEGGLSDAQLAEIVGYIARSAIFTRRIGAFEASGGRIEFEKEEKNYFWDDRGVPTVYLAPSFKNTNTEVANISSITQVLAHEMSHFETYFPSGVGINPNNEPNENSAGALGVCDEARAYSLEYLVQREINASAPPVDWLQTDQETGARIAIAALPAGASEIEQLDAATLAILDWAANWTDDESKGGYFQFYQNAWLTVNAPGRSVVSTKVSVRCDAKGSIREVEFTDAQEGRRIAVIDPTIGRYTPRRG